MLRERFTYSIDTEVDRSKREQHRFLEHCMGARVELTLVSIQGHAFNGIVHGFDKESILFGGSGRSAVPRLFQKSFIALITPHEDINLFSSYKGLGTARQRNRKTRFLKALQERETGSNES